MPADPPALPAPRVTKRRAETRSRLLAAAAEVFAERGFGRATVEEVCERAGYSRGAFYSNFDNLDALFFALAAQRSSVVVRQVGEVVAATPAGVSLGEVIDRVVTALPIDRESHLLNLELAAHALRHDEVAATLTDHRRQVRQALVPVLRAGLVSRGAIVDDAQLDAVARAVMAVQDGMFLQELLEPADAALPALRRTMLTELIQPIGSGNRPGQ